MKESIRNMAKNLHITLQNIGNILDDCFIPSIRPETYFNKHHF